MRLIQDALLLGFIGVAIIGFVALIGSLGLWWVRRRAR